MKVNKKIIYLICFLVLVVIIYCICLLCFGNHDNIVLNKPVSDILKNQPRLQDDYYNHVNYKYLSTNQLDEDEDSWYYMYSDSLEMINKEKKAIIDNILNNCNNHVVGSVNDKICSFYYSYKNNSKEETIRSEIDYYINLINNTKSVDEYVSTVLNINKELSMGLLVNPSINFMPTNLKQHYFTLNEITYDYDVTKSEYYSLDLYEQELNKIKKYDVKILKEYGYKDNEAYKMVNDIQSMYKEIARFSIKSDKLIDKGYKVYNINQLQNELKVLNLTSIVKKYSDIYTYGGSILVADINQLKAIDTYLTNDNLSTLKKYAIMRILTEYSKYINTDFYKINNEFEEDINGIAEEFRTDEELIYHYIYLLFQDTITSEFSKRNFTEQESQFYTKLVLEEIETFKTRIMSEQWLTEKTKISALDKMQKIKYTVGVPKQFVYAENNYVVSKDNSYLQNIININQSINSEHNRQYKLGNIMYGHIDYLEQNAFYQPNTNSITLLLGIIYSYKTMLNIDVNNLDTSYYKLLGTIGLTVGHELSHALDSSGSMYDGDGNYINWWTEEDLNNFNKLNIAVVKYYNNYNQFGTATLGENIADLGGMAIVMEIAKSRGATENDYKTIFEHYALDFCSQSTPYYRANQLRYDVHSPNKNRVNAVLSSTEEFYSVYSIMKSDDMYVSNEKRVSVW